MPHNNQLQRTVERRRGRGASASLHCALAPRRWAQRAAAELQRFSRDFILETEGKELAYLDVSSWRERAFPVISALAKAIFCHR